MDKDLITIDLSNLDLSYSADYNIDLSNISLDSGIYTASDTITITGSSFNTDYTFDWIEDQRICDEYKEERLIRERNEGVQKAWEQYKIMVALAKEPPENLDD